MKFSDILSTATYNMMRSKARTFLTILAIFIGTFTIAMTVGISSGVSSYIDEQVGNIGAEDMLIIQGKGEDPFADGPQKYQENVNTSNTAGIPMVMLSQSDVDNIKSEKGIISAELDKNVAPNYIFGQNSEKYSFTASSFFDGINVTLAAGKTPDNSSSQPQILLIPSFVSPLGYSSASDAVGKNVTIGIKTPAGQQREVTAEITGVQEQTIVSIGGLMTNKALNTQLFDLQSEELPAELKSQQPVAVARFDKNMSESEVQDLKKNLDEKGYIALTIQDQIGIFKQVIDAITYVLIFFGAIALLAASLGIINTLFMSVQERTKEIGLMKAMGMARSKVFTLFSVEAALLGFWGSLAGALAAIGVGSIANNIASNSFLKDLPGFNLTHFPLLSVIGIMLIVMAIAFLAGTLPARRASKQDAIEALRYE